MPQAQRAGKNFQDFQTPLRVAVRIFQKAEFFQRKTWRGLSKPLFDPTNQQIPATGNKQGINRELGAIPNIPTLCRVGIHAQPPLPALPREFCRAGTRQELSVARLEYQTSFLLPGFDGFFFFFLLWAFCFNIH